MRKWCSHFNNAKLATIYILHWQWVNFGYMEVLKTETKGSHLIEAVAGILKRVYLPALTNFNGWGGLPALQVSLRVSILHSYILTFLQHPNTSDCVCSSTYIVLLRTFSLIHSCYNIFVHNLPSDRETK